MGGVATPFAMSARRSTPGTPVNQGTAPRRPNDIPVYLPSYVPPTRKTASEGTIRHSSVDQGIDQIPELASSPQRGIYTWREPSPPGPLNHRSHPNSPADQPDQYRHLTMPPSPQLPRKHYDHGGYHQQQMGMRVLPSPQHHRPMTFSRAMQVSDSMEAQQAHGVQYARRGKPLSPSSGDSERRSVYDMNYEISV